VDVVSNYIISAIYGVHRIVKSCFELR